MIHVSQGHESGIGLEIFIKSFLCLDKKYREHIILHCFFDSLKKCLDLTSINYSIKNSYLIISDFELKLKLQSNIDYSESQTSLISAIKSIKENDILLTLPTSKDQFYHHGSKCSGHTEFFRSYFNKPEISMNFISDQFNLTLLTDHIDIKNVSQTLKPSYITKKVSLTLKNIDKLVNINEVLFTGINPHAGEEGVISHDDSNITESISTLKELYPTLMFKGPYPADTIHMHKFSSNKLYVYAFHDQGLAPFKLYNGLYGVNLTLGLPFIRVSVDHGTAFDKYGKNSANYFSLLYLIEKIKPSIKLGP